jgi:NADPH-dependent 2,4-dienoyl-CoA reductase/sulfur reductase-like enzyme
MLRRELLQNLGAGLGAISLASCANMSTSSAAKAHVVVVGGGFGGATAAKYIRMWSGGSIAVTLIEPNDSFISCPISNMVIGGFKQMSDITIPYTNLADRHGVVVVKDKVQSLNADKRTVTLASGKELSYDRVIVSPGVDFMWDTLPGMNNPDAQSKILHAWKAGPQTAALRKQLEDMPDGGVFAISIPLAPYRCPPGPYERASVVADYFLKAKPKSKVLILDGNDDVTSKGPLFKKAWAEMYKNIIEYRPKHSLSDVDVANKTLKFEFNDPIKADVLNVIPPMRAGEIAVKSGLATANKRWCEVDYLTFESKAAKNVHVLGDSLQIAPGMPKSGHMANQHGKSCAAAVVALLSNKVVNNLPIYSNTCYSYVSENDAIHVASVHRYDAEKKTMTIVPGSGGVSAARSAIEGAYAMAWANNIWSDTLA